MRALAIMLLAAWPAFAAPGIDEVMADPALQERAMDLYDDLRCVQCRSEAIGSSNAPWAQDARAAVRARLDAGDSDAEVLAYFQARYGDYVLMNPPLTATNFVLWIAGPLFLILGGIVALRFVRARAAPAAPPPALDPEEEARLAALLREDARG